MISKLQEIIDESNFIYFYINYGILRCAMWEGGVGEKKVDNYLGNVIPREN